jgi:hypothetical protein
MAHSVLLFATRVVEVMFFTGLVGCASVVFASWISIFKDGFSDIRNRDGESHWDSQQHKSVSAKSRSASASLV